MANRTIQVDDRLYDYLLSVSRPEVPALRALRDETAAMPMAIMQISPEQGQFMALLLKSIGAERYLEVGTFTGYSALVCALALPEHGRVVTLDISEEWTGVARRHWQNAGVEKKIELRLGPASTSMQTLLSTGYREQFDFIFVDADKTGYGEYFELGLDLLRPGGLMAFDNVLWNGQVADPEVVDDDTVALRAINETLKNDERIEISMVPIGDGLTLARKRD